jgi:hypothetical protein
MRFRVQPVSTDDDRWQIQTFAYSYLLFRDDREIVGYHWDDEAVAAGAVRTPHVHLGKDLPHLGLPREDRDRLGSISAAHLPTGLIPFTEVLRAAIRDFGVDPIRQRGDSPDDARVRAERTFEEAEAAMVESFIWWTGPGSAAQ